ncbi:MAG: hypothetical protein M1435_02230 [Actinobacteria bacterium]|jgi:hypothetical protein|nr:hypothetical protein [Actinomycetota bacterium]MDA8303235.1 hypothetical protein [Actinomycetota bacterium]
MDFDLAGAELDPSVRGNGSAGQAADLSVGDNGSEKRPMPGQLWVPNGLVLSARPLVVAEFSRSGDLLVRQADGSRRLFSPDGEPASPVSAKARPGLVLL